jgi:tetratricopeptide (TPR) repeat protein
LPAKNNEVESAAPPWRSGLPALLAAALLSVLALAAYWRSFAAPFVFDDGPSIVDNPTIHALGTSLRPPADTTVSGRPVLNLSLAANYAAGGGAVWGYHAVNLAVHVLAGLALFGIVRRTLGRLGAGDATGAALCAALLWTLHPLQTESVTYVIQRAESLMGLLYLATLYCFIRGCDAAGPARAWWFPGSVACCFLGMGTKEVMVSAPLIVLLYDATFIAGSLRGALALRGRYYLGLAASWLLLGCLVLSTHGRAGTAGFGAGVSPRAYALTQVYAVVHYAGLAFWPSPLVFDYGRDLLPVGPWLVPCALVLAALAAATVWMLARRPALGFLAVCFFALLAPSSSLVPVATEPMAEHRMYLALAPVIVLAVLGMRRVLGRGLVPVCSVAAAVLLCLTWQRNGDYRSDEALWTDTVSKRPGNDRAHNDLGFILASEPGRRDDAIAQYRSALGLSPNYSTAHYNLAMALVGKPGGLEEAIAEFEATIRLDPGLAEARFNLGRALMEEPGRMEDAARQYEETLRIRPDFPGAQYNLGCALGSIPGRAGESVAHYEAALRQDPGLVEAHFNLGCVLAQMPGRLDDAISQFQAAVRLRPDYLPAILNLGTALGSAGRGPEAVAFLREAQSRLPGNEAIHRLMDRLSAAP